jgi:hypothetical protein
MHPRTRSHHSATRGIAPSFLRQRGIIGACMLGIGLLLAAAASSAFAADKMVAVSEEIDLAASPARTWSAIKDFDRWQSWHPAFARTSIVKGAANQKGEVRVLATRDGAKFTEELVSHDRASRSYEYRIIESPLPISGYVSKLEVQKARRGSHVVWSSTFRVDEGASEEEVRKTISGVYRTGLDNLATVVPAQPSTY